jgi:transposase
VTTTGDGDGSAKAIEVVLGVDTHLHIHVAVALNQLGRRLGEFALPTTIKGYEKLICWAKGFGSIKCVGD